MNDKIYGKNDQFFIDYIDKDTQNNKKAARHSLHSSKLSFSVGSEAISQEIGLPVDLAEIWNASAPVGAVISNRPCSTHSPSARPVKDNGPYLAGI